MMKVRSGRAMGSHRPCSRLNTCSRHRRQPIQMADNHRRDHRADALGVHGFVKQQLNGCVDHLHCHPGSGGQLLRIGLGKHRCEDLRLCPGHLSMGVDSHVFQRRYCAQPFENPHAAQGCLGDPIGLQDQLGERGLQRLGRTGQQLRRNPVIDQPVLFVQQAFPQYRQQCVFVWKVAVQRRRGEPGTFTDQVGGQALDSHIAQGLRGRDQNSFVGFSTALLCRRFFVFLGFPDGSGRTGAGSVGLGHRHLVKKG